MILVIEDKKFAAQIQTFLAQGKVDPIVLPDGIKQYDSDYLLDAFCEKEAIYRLKDEFQIPEEKITEELISRVSSEILKSIDHMELLYDEIDDVIRNVLDEIEEEAEEEKI